MKNWITMLFTLAAATAFGQVASNSKKLDTNNTAGKPAASQNSNPNPVLISNKRGDTGNPALTDDSRTINAPVDNKKQIIGAAPAQKAQDKNQPK